MSGVNQIEVVRHGAHQPAIEDIACLRKRDLMVAR